MKILHVTQGYFPAIGGTEWLIQRLSEELVRQFGDEVTVFTTNCFNGEAFFSPQLPRLSTGWEEINGVKVRRFPVYSRISQLFSTLSSGNSLSSQFAIQRIFTRHWWGTNHSRLAESYQRISC